MKPYSYTEIAKMIDHSLLNPTLTPDELENGCRLAAAFDTASVCILPYAVPQAPRWLSGSDVAIGTTIGFPHGGQSTAVKFLEARQALKDGAVELDMVVNISLVRAGRFEEVETEISGLTELTHEKGGKLKVIFENCFLDAAAIVELCEICGRAGVDWVKTSTGYGDGGAVDEDLKLMREHSPDMVQVKAAGGVRTLERLLEVRNLGCSRVGATRTVSICNDARLELGMDILEGYADTPAGY